MLDISGHLPEEVFAFFIVFTRLGAMIMMLPGLGESAVPARVRLMLALSISLIIFTLVRSSLPSIPASPYMLGILIITEVLVGSLIGLTIKIVMSALHTAGAIIAMQTGLAAAQAFDPVQGAQSALMATFLTLIGTVLIFAMNLHHLMIEAMLDSYSLFPVGQGLNIDDFAALMARNVASSFLLGVQIASPFIVYALIFNIGLGILARLMPQLQVFFVAMPLNIVMGLVIMAMVISSAMIWFADYMEKTIGSFMV